MSTKHLKTGDAIPALAPGVLRLYSMRWCPYCIRTKLVLAAKGIKYEEVLVNLTDKPEWLFVKNPQGKVPVLEQDGKIVPESLITSEYLDDLYPGQNPLYPADAYLKAKQKLLIERFGAITSTFVKVLRGAEQADRAEAAKQVFKLLEDYEAVLQESGKPFFRGDTAGMVDYMLYPFVDMSGTLEHFTGLKFTEYVADKLPKLASWLGHMAKDGAVKSCNLDPAKRLAFRKTYVTGKPNYDG